MQIDPDRSGGGNTQNPSSSISKPKQSPLRKNHFFTYNNYKDEEIDPIVLTLKQFAYKGKIQTEIGENGTPHLQGMIWCHKKHRDSEFKLPKQIHWETLKDTDNTSNYCAKEDTHDGKFRTSWGFPMPLILIKPEEFYPWQQQVIEETKERFYGTTNRTIYWCKGDGNLGKSAFIKYMMVQDKTVLLQGGSVTDIMNIVFNTNWDEKYIVMFNLTKSHKGNISYTALENIGDGLVVNTKYETGYKAFNPPWIYVFANFWPTNIEGVMEDRWYFRTINEDKTFSERIMPNDIHSDI